MVSVTVDPRTRAQRVDDAIAEWKALEDRPSLARWLGWSAEEFMDFEECGAFPYPRRGAL